MNAYLSHKGCRCCMSVVPSTMIVQPTSMQLRTKTCYKQFETTLMAAKHIDKFGAG